MSSLRRRLIGLGKIGSTALSEADRELLITALLMQELRLRSAGAPASEDSPILVIATAYDPPGLWADDDPRLAMPAAPPRVRQFGLAVRVAVQEAFADALRRHQVGGSPRLVLDAVLACPEALRHPDIVPSLTARLISIAPLLRVCATKEPRRPAARTEIRYLELIYQGIPDQLARAYLSVVDAAADQWEHMLGADGTPPLRALTYDPPWTWPDWGAKWDSTISARCKRTVEPDRKESGLRVRRNFRRHTMPRYEEFSDAFRAVVTAGLQPGVGSEGYRPAPEDFDPESWQERTLRQLRPPFAVVVAGLRAAHVRVEMINEVLVRYMPKAAVPIDQSLLLGVARRRWPQLCLAAACPTGAGHTSRTCVVEQGGDVITLIAVRIVLGEAVDEEEIRLALGQSDA